MNQIVFSKISDLYITPQDFFDAHDREFHFVLDAAANKQSRKCPSWLGPGGKYPDALAIEWSEAIRQAQAHAGVVGSGAVWWNCPYSMCAAFVAKAAEERRAGVTSVGLIPARTDTRWFHEHIWNRVKHQPRRGIQIRPVKGRLTFSLHITRTMRAAVKAAPKVREKILSKRLGLPRLVIRCIRAGDPVAVESAPFPSLVVVFDGTVK